MPTPLIPIAGLAVSALPELAKWLGGDRNGEVARQVSDTAKAVFGTDDAGTVEQAMASDPQAALAWRFRLAEIAAAEDHRRHEEAMARFADMAGIRQQTAEFVRTGSRIAWGAPAVSMVVMVTFGIVLWLTLTKQVPAGQEATVSLMLGALTTMATAVVSYWVGSSAGSAAKNDMLRGGAGGALPIPGRRPG
ncbi:MAG TPA: hypothetical protein VK943_03890 [Arenibaculum sp.]|nr:hypothetical protein [Arenibaculum sp.]